MRRTGRRSGALALAFAIAGTAVIARPTSAQVADGVTRDAAKHFQRGVTLYGEGDYRAAVVEFKRAYALVPNAAVLYNVGETEYQLRDYAGALTTFRRYLVEANPAEAHRSEVESNVEVLRARVGRLSIQSVPPGADVSIDDQSIGKAPLTEPAFVSIGHRKVVATMAGRPSVSRYVDVAAEDNLSITLTLPPSESLPPSVPRQATAAPRDVGSSPREASWATLRVAGWLAAGTLAAGAVTFGLLATREANDLKIARNTFPTTGSTLNHDASLTAAYSITADSLAAAAIVVGGLTLYSTLSGSGRPKHGAADIRVTLSPSSARVETTF